MLRRVGAVAAALSMTLALAGCGSDDESDGEGSGGKQADSAGANAEQVDEPEEGGAGERPEGFPEDVPVPAGEVRSSSQVGDVGWRAMIAVPLDADMEALKTEYTALYEDAGFTVTQEGTVHNLMATNDKWRVDLVVRPPTITVQVLDQSG